MITVIFMWKPNDIAASFIFFELEKHWAVLCPSHSHLLRTKGIDKIDNMLYWNIEL